jgi:hypothetical protein
LRRNPAPSPHLLKITQAAAQQRLSIGVPLNLDFIAVDRIERAMPRAVEPFEQVLGRRLCARDKFIGRSPILRLVIAVRINSGSTPEPAMGQRKAFACDVSYASISHRCFEPKAW